MYLSDAVCLFELLKRCPGVVPDLVLGTRNASPAPFRYASL